jgi:hypothetical protein
MRNREIRNAMAERGHEMTNAEVQETKESIVTKFTQLFPEIRGMSTDDALQYIADKVGPHI